MTERHHALSPEHIRQLKDELTQRWRQLPAEHQASMVLVLLGSVLKGEWGPWLKEAIAIRWSETLDPLEMPFPVTSICRADLKALDFTGDEIARLGDHDMAEIASLMEDHYVEHTFWDSLGEIARDILAHKGPQ